MPLYEYQCQDCDARFEALRPMSQSNDAIACPRCAGDHARRLMSACACVSKDSGGASRMVSGSSGGGCGSCGGGHCASCGH
jgi:putative FmdB family regulatory protein